MMEYLLFLQVCTLAHGCEWQSSRLSFMQEQQCVVAGLSRLSNVFGSVEGFACKHERIPLPRPRPRPKGI